MHIITVANQKGGVGKTTTTVTLAHGLALQGRRVWIVDFDPQGHCATSLGVQQESGVFDLLVARYPLAQVLRQTNRDNLAIVPGDKRTATAQVVLNTEHAPLDKVRQVLRPRGQAAAELPDVMVLDTNPSVGGMQEMAIYAADLVIIPCAMDYLSADGVVQIVETMHRLQQSGWAGHLFGIIPTFYDLVTKESAAILADLRETYQDLVLPTISRATIMRECVAEALTIWEKAPDAPIAKQYAELVWRLRDATP